MKKIKKTFYALPHVLWDSSSPARDWTQALGSARLECKPGPAENSLVKYIYFKKNLLPGSFLSTDLSKDF